MTDLFIICMGQSKREFVNSALAPLQNYMCNHVILIFYVKNVNILIVG